MMETWIMLFQELRVCTGLKIWAVSNWKMHQVGVMPVKQLGATSFDVDMDGWEDIIIGRYWYRNTQNPREEAFIRYQYDERIEANIHDIVMADVDGDDAGEVIITGIMKGYSGIIYQTEPTRDDAWQRTEPLPWMYWPAGIICMPVFSPMGLMIWMVTETRTWSFLIDGWRNRTRERPGKNIHYPLAKEVHMVFLHEAGLLILTGMVTMTL